MSNKPLRAACIHGRYERHRFVWDSVDLGDGMGSGGGTGAPRRCPGGRDITKAEIIAEYLGRTNATGGNVDAPAI